MTTQLTTLERIITELKELNEFDGETVEYLLEKLGYDDYALRYLVMKSDLTVIQNHLDERAELHPTEELPQVKEFKHRLTMVYDDTRVLENYIRTNHLTEFFAHTPSSKGDDGLVHLNNIQVACDLTTKECLSWRLFDEDKVVEPTEERNGLKYEWQNITNFNHEIKHLSKLVWTEYRSCDGRKHFFQVNNVINNESKLFIHSVIDDIENNDTLTFNTFDEYWEYKVKQTNL